MLDIGWRDNGFIELEDGLAPPRRKLRQNCAITCWSPNYLFRREIDSVIVNLFSRFIEKECFSRKLILLITIFHFIKTGARAEMAGGSPAPTARGFIYWAAVAPSGVRFATGKSNLVTEGLNPGTSRAINLPSIHLAVTFVSATGRQKS